MPLLAEAIRLNPEAADAYCTLALALRNTGQHEKALEALATAVRLAPDNEWPHRLRSIVLMGLQRKKEAIAAALQAERLAPDVWQAVYTVGDTYLECGMFKKAQATAERLLRLEPDNARTFWLLGRIASTTNRLLAAEAHLLRALSLDPTSTHLHNDLGVVLQRQGRLKEAMQHFHGALTSDPTAAHTQHNLYASATTYLRQKLGFSSSKRLLEEISPAVYRYYTDRSRQAFQGLVMNFLKRVLMPVVALMALSIGLELAGDNRDVDWLSYVKFLLGLIAVFGALTALSWLGFVLSRARDRFPWLGPVFGILLSPLMLIMLGITGLSLDEGHWILYLLMVIVGLVFSLILWGRSWRGRYYTLLSRWYPKYEELRTRLRRRIVAVTGRPGIRPFVLILGNPLFYFVTGSVALYFELLPRLVLLWILFVCAGIVLGVMALLHRISP